MPASPWHRPQAVGHHGVAGMDQGVKAKKNATPCLTTITGILSYFGNSREVHSEFAVFSAVIGTPWTPWYAPLAGIWLPSRIRPVGPSAWSGAICSARGA